MWGYVPDVNLDSGPDPHPILEKAWEVEMFCPADLYSTVAKPFFNDYGHCIDSSFWVCGTNS